MSMTFATFNVDRDRDRFDDPLDDILPPMPSEPVRPTTQPTPAAEQVRRHRQNCWKCNGSGQTRWGVCFACQGAGGRDYVQPAAVRAVKRDQAADRRQAALADNVAGFKATYPAEWTWIEERVTWEIRKSMAADAFGHSLRDRVVKYGELSERQLAAVRTNMAKRAAALEARANAPGAAAITVERIEQAFDTARAAGLSKLVLRLATTKTEMVNGKPVEILDHAYTFKPAKAHLRNPGAIYVTEGSEYLGKVVAGKFLCTDTCDQVRRDQVVAVASDPTQAAVAHGRVLGSCSCCGRELSDPVSVARGIGPDCAEHFGF